MISKRTAFTRRIAAFTALALSGVSHAQHIRIAEVFAGGGGAASTYIQDYVVLFNPGAAAVDLTGWTLQHAGITDPYSNNKTVPLVGMIQPGGYYLISIPGTAGMNNIPTPDVISPPPAQFTDNTLATAGGKIALVSNNTIIQIEPCTTPLADPDVVDFVGYGLSASCREGSNGPTDNAPAGSSTTSIHRTAAGCVDTDVSSNDFSTQPPNPRSTTSPTATCFAGAVDVQTTMVEAEDPVDLGDLSRYTVTLASIGTVPAAGATLTFIYPATATLVSATPAPTTIPTPGTLEYAIAAPLAPGASLTFTIEIRMPAAGFYNITVIGEADGDTAFQNNTRVLRSSVFNPAFGNLLVGAAVATSAIETPYLVDTSTGVAKRFTTVPLNITALAADDSSRCFWAAVNSGIRLYRIPYDEPRTPVDVAGFSVGGGGTTQGINGLAMLGSVLFASDTQESTSSVEGFYAVNTATGATVEIFRFGTQNGLVDLEGFEGDAALGVFYALNDDSDGIPIGTGRGIYRFTTAGAPTKIADYTAQLGSQTQTDIDGLALGNGKLYLVPDERGEIAIYDIAAAAFDPPIPNSWQTVFTASAAAFTMAISHPPCPADFNQSGEVSVQDIFDFLAAYFTNDPRADFNGIGGITVQDIFDFLAAYFTAC